MAVWRWRQKREPSHEERVEESKEKQDLERDERQQETQNRNTVWTKLHWS